MKEGVSMQKGFTLIELLVVIAIVALGGNAVPSLYSRQGESTHDRLFE